MSRTYKIEFDDDDFDTDEEAYPRETRGIRSAMARRKIELVKEQMALRKQINEFDFGID